MGEWMERCLGVFAGLCVSGMYLAYRVVQQKPPEPSLSSDLKRYLQSESEEIPESVKQVFVKWRQFNEELTSEVESGTTLTEAFIRVMEKRKFLEELFSSSGGSGI